ncbi:MAG TPA: universal stress protein [Steroidobacteraceae bacterium]|nr:universal stress protein [Steroidobacteraceae bacterium]
MARRSRTARWKTILVVVANPFAGKQIAAEKAAAIAKRCGARVVLFNAFMVPQPVNDVPLDSREQIIASAIRQRELRLRDIAARARLPHNTQHIVRWDYPIYEAIVRQVQKTRPDLLIADSHREGKLARLVLVNTDWQLMRECPCPLWFVRSAELPRRLQVLVAVDPRHTHAKPAKLDDRLLQSARSIEAQLGARVSLVHAYETPASSVPGMMMEPIRLPLAPERTREFIATTTATVARLADKYGVGGGDCALREGAAHNVIPAEARSRKADLLVMGAVSRSLLARPVIGSTAERVIDHVDCDVFVVKPAGFKSRVKRSAVKA